MSEIETGGRAFPWCGDLNETPSINLGLTARDYFAAKALQGLLAMQANDTYGTQFEPFRWSNPDHVSGVAEGAYLLADAMIRARGIA